jgi:rubrerythrin
MKTKNINVNHNLYIVRVYGKEGSLIKVGYSSKIQERINSYYTSNPLMELVGTYYREDALEFENKLHKILDSAVMKEWYSEDKLDVVLSYIANGLPNISFYTARAADKKDYKAMVKLYNETGNIEEYKYKSDYYTLITQSLQLYNKVWANYTYAKQMVENYSNEYVRVQLTITHLFKEGEKYDVKEVKQKLQKVYDDYGINRKAKSTDLQEFMFVKEVKSNGSRFVEVINKNKTVQ